MKLIAKTPLIQIIDFKKQTRDSFLQQCKIGDWLRFEVPIKAVGSNRGRTYATNVTCYNINEQIKKEYSMNMVKNIFNVLELREVT